MLQAASVEDIGKAGMDARRMVESLGDVVQVTGAGVRSREGRRVPLQGRRRGPLQGRAQRV